MQTLAPTFESFRLKGEVEYFSADQIKSPSQLAQLVCEIAQAGGKVVSVCHFGMQRSMTVRQNLRDQGLQVVDNIWAEDHLGFTYSELDQLLADIELTEEGQLYCPRLRENISCIVLNFNPQDEVEVKLVQPILQKAEELVSQGYPLRLLVLEGDEEAHMSYHQYSPSFQVYKQNWHRDLEERSRLMNEG